jgi:hypothetical protein
MRPLSRLGKVSPATFQTGPSGDVLESSEEHSYVLCVVIIQGLSGYSFYLAVGVGEKLSPGIGRFGLLYCSESVIQSLLRSNAGVAPLESCTM